MIIQSPESAMPEPFKTYVRQRSETIANVLNEVVGINNVQLCPRAITPAEQLFDAPEDILYGALVSDISDGYKSSLYTSYFGKPEGNGIATKDIKQAARYSADQFNLGNRVRLKDPRESDGKGQITIESVSEIDATFRELSDGGEEGVVIMPHLATISSRVSVGRIRLGEVGCYHYAGSEINQAHEGSMVYGGTTLGLFKDTFTKGKTIASDYLKLPVNLVEMGMNAIDKYLRLAINVGRVSVDVIEGFTDNGSVFRDVIDITPRVGGTTPAEVLAIKELQSNCDSVCIARSQLLYNPRSTPAKGTNFIDTDTLVINAQVLEVLQ